MPLAIALLTVSLILIKAGWKNQNVIDVALGRDTRNSTGNVTGGTDVTDNTGTVSPINPGKSHIGTKMIDGHPVALWIVPYITYARHQGWCGQVTSGYRPPWQKVTPSPGLPVAPQGQSNHNRLAFPGGAIDVSDPDGFEAVLRRFPGPVPLKRDPSIGDPVHFSVTGR